MEKNLTVLLDYPDNQCIVSLENSRSFAESHPLRHDPQSPANPDKYRDSCFRHGIKKAVFRPSVPESVPFCRGKPQFVRFIPALQSRFHQEIAISFGKCLRARRLPSGIPLSGLEPGCRCFDHGNAVGRKRQLFGGLFSTAQIKPLGISQGDRFRLFVEVHHEDIIVLSIRPHPRNDTIWQRNLERGLKFHAGAKGIVKIIMKPVFWAAGQIESLSAAELIDGGGGAACVKISGVDSERPGGFGMNQRAILVDGIAPAQAEVVFSEEFYVVDIRFMERIDFLIPNPQHFSQRAGESAEETEVVVVHNAAPVSGHERAAVAHEALDPFCDAGLDHVEHGRDEEFVGIEILLHVDDIHSNSPFP
jgi:hypothetical protein